MKQLVKQPEGILTASKMQEVSSLVQKLWISENRKTTVCVDSYEDGILQGRLYGSDGTVQSFQSLSRFLIMMEQLLEQRNEPQSDTIQRSFSAYLPHPTGTGHWESIPRGTQATFELQILFRQHTSWQGMIFWQDQNRQQSFRSVLELVRLMDSALGEQERSVAG